MADNLTQTAMQLAMKKGEIKGKQEMLDKLSPTINHAIDIIDNNIKLHDSIEQHIKSQNESIMESTNTYKEEMIRREKKAKEFCQGKNVDQLKEYLADQPVPYNSWRNADCDTLVQLVMDIYEEL